MKLYVCAFITCFASWTVAQTTLGDFTFDDALFGDTLSESDGGTYSSSNWLNTVNSSPGNPGYLTGVGFNTGIANIGLGGNATTYTLGYNTPIVNRPGADVGVVVARFSGDTISIAFSADGTTFGSSQAFGPETAIETGVHRSYFYGGGGPYDAELFVHPLDLSDFGFAENDTVMAAQISGSTQLDLIRVAGFAPVPEPATMVALSLGVLALLKRKR